MIYLYPDVEDGFSLVSIDLDGVLAQNTWPSPDVGRAIPEGLAALEHYWEKGYEIIVFTARPESHAPKIWSWLKHYDIEFMVYDVVCGKPRAGLYIDDRAWNPWREK